MAEKKPKGKKTGEFREEAKLGVSDEYSKMRETRSLELKKNLNTRLSRMEGQMKGVRQMVENDRYYVDLVVQGISLISAMKSFCRIVTAKMMIKSTMAIADASPTFCCVWAI